ncbi:MAG TPA: VWA domain-containing protein [Mucilaginibacter sp.]|nr:VWA domain-containing protein [Mucilaginibacter sp.]
MESFEFTHLWVLISLVGIPVLLILYFKNYKINTASLQVSVVRSDNFKRKKPGIFHLPVFLRCLGLSFFIIAIAGPVRKNGETVLDGRSKDIILCIDVSASMQYEDFKPNRLEASKALAEEFVRKRTGDELGVVIFSNTAYSLCPLTTDTAAVLGQLSGIATNLLDREGTDIGNGLAVAINRLKNSNAKTKIIVLLTDGVNTTNGPISPATAVDIAAGYHIKIYSLGIGSTREMEITIKTPYGLIRQTKKLEYDEQLLKQIAAGSSGQYFQAADNNALQNAYGNIDRLEKTEIVKKVHYSAANMSLPFVLAGFISILLDAILSYSVFRKFP